MSRFAYAEISRLLQQRECVRSFTTSVLHCFSAMAARFFHNQASGCKTLAKPWWARGEREGYGGPRDVTSLSLSLAGRMDAPSETRRVIYHVRVDSTPPKDKSVDRL